MKYEVGGGGDLNMMNHQTFADARVMEQIFKCQPVAHCCWNTSRRLSAARRILTLSCYLYSVIVARLTGFNGRGGRGVSICFRAPQLNKKIHPRAFAWHG